MSGGSKDFKLEQLFKRCDTRGDGFIGQKEFRDLCRDFGIENGDADTIFYDLDHDGDGSISFEDFAFGFRDFVTPGARRGSIQLELARQPSIREGGRERWQLGLEIFILNDLLFTFGH